MKSSRFQLMTPPGLRASDAHRLLSLLALLLLTGCATIPTAEEYQKGVRDVPPAIPGVPPSLIDARPRFREIFCGIAMRSGVARDDDHGCEALLWRLSDEAPFRASAGLLPQRDIVPRVVMVPGSFSDCLSDEAKPFGVAAAELVARGYRIDTIPVSGRSSADHNARTLAAALRAPSFAGSERIVLLGYSKGAVDVLHLLANYPDIGSRVIAVLSVAGPIVGSPLATTGDWLYDTLLKHALPKTCDPGDGGVIDSLVPETRREWMARHPLPAHVRFFSVAAFPQRDLLSSALKPAWQMLARHDRRNDGQVTAGDALIPDSALLGYANADHWGVALRIEAILPHLAARRNRRPFPQTEFLEAMLLFVGEQLAAGDGLAAMPGPR